MHGLRALKQLCRFLVLTERRINEDQILDCERVALILGLNVR